MSDDRRSILFSSQNTQDVEQISERADTLAIASRFFPPDEAAAVAADPACFFRLWTRREAYLKALGVGISGIGLPIPADYFIRDVEAAPGYAAAVACEKPGIIRTATPG